MSIFRFVLIMLMVASNMLVALSVVGVFKINYKQVTNKKTRFLFACVVFLIQLASIWLGLLLQTSLVTIVLCVIIALQISYVLYNFYCDFKNYRELNN